jgi:phytoene dehydrogenase-like protein
MNRQNQVVIIGAGLCGLAAAYHLEKAGLAPILVDRAPTVGGRVRTDAYRGFLLDRGFQVVLSAFPELRRCFSMDELELRPFISGFKLRLEGRWCEVRNPLRHPLSTLGTTSLPFSLWLDVMRFVRLYMKTGRREPPSDQTISQLFDRYRISPSFQDLCLRPFCGAAFLDLDLTTSAALFSRLLHWYFSGYACLPARGMEQLPRQLASRLGKTTVRLDSHVAAIGDKNIVLASGERIEAAALILAVDRQSVGELVELSEPASYRSTTCLYYRIDSDLIPSTSLLYLDGTSEGPINHFAFPSLIQPSYAPRGQALASATVVHPDWQNEPKLEEKVKQQLGAWFHTRTTAWHHLRTYRIERALPDQSSPLKYAGCTEDPTRPWLFLSGELTGPASINSSLTSGREAAEQVLRYLHSC